MVLAIATGATAALIIDFRQSAEASVIYAGASWTAQFWGHLGYGAPSIILCLFAGVMLASLSCFFLLKPSTVLGAFARGIAMMAVLTLIVPAQTAAIEAY